MSPSIRTSVLRWVAAAFPQLVYGYARTYRVAAVRADKTLDLSPPVDAPHLPELDGVEQWGLGLVTPAEGSEVLVQFRDANPARPIVIGWEHGAEHERVDLLEVSDPSVVEPTGRVVRYGDSVTIPVAGAVAQGPVSVGVPPSDASRVRG